MKSYNEQEIRDNYRSLTKRLIEKKLTITTMESATSGQIASLITDTEGSSAVLKGAFITYCNEAKIKQGVPAEILDKYTVYSRETAEAMANILFHTIGHRAETRTLGERAMNELYLSWEDSVKTAMARYRFLLDHRREFQKPHRRTGSDDFLLTVSELLRIRAALRALPERIQERTDTVIDVLHPPFRPPLLKKKAGNDR